MYMNQVYDHIWSIWLYNFLFCFFIFSVEFYWILYQGPGDYIPTLWKCQPHFSIRIISLFLFLETAFFFSAFLKSFPSFLMSWFRHPISSSALQVTFRLLPLIFLYALFIPPALIFPSFFLPFLLPFLIIEKTSLPVIFDFIFLFLASLLSSWSVLLLSFFLQDFAAAFRQSDEGEQESSWHLSRFCFPFRSVSCHFSVITFLRHI